MKRPILFVYLTKDDDNVAINEASAAEPTIFDDEEVTMTMDQTLIKTKAKKARLLGEQMAKRLHDEEIEQAAAKEKQETDDLEKAKVLQKQKPISIAQARKNMIVYLKNMAGYKMEHFKDKEPTKKRVAEETLLQESFKKLKAVEVSCSHSTQDTPTDDPKEMCEEDVKNMLEIVPVINMPRATVGDTSRTKSYIPKVSKILRFSPVIAQFYKPVKNRCIHEGRVMDQLYLNEPIVPRFILDFYSQVKVQTNEHDYLLISFMIQHEFITLSLSLAQFGQILKIPYNVQAVYTNEWDLSSLPYSQETEGPYQTHRPTPDDIHRFLQIKRVDLNGTICRPGSGLLGLSPDTRDRLAYI
uniref:Uncharacterized protein n=1 Tax=Tanacetum cinerariifolium TaxID=118510 RepID=A0A6L2JN86_TANCI|nr:hypothetical protein [Tanacetum cinerariifolium]